MSNLEPFLNIKTGVILANFNLSGKLPMGKEALTENTKGSDIWYLIIFETDTLYGPEDLLTFILPIKVQISSEVNGDKLIDST